MKNRIIAFGLTIIVGIAGLAPAAALAGENQAKNVAIGATAVSAYLLSQKKTRKAGYVATAGTVYLWKKYADSRKARRQREIAQTNYYRRLAARNARTARYYRSRSYRARGHRYAHR